MDLLKLECHIWTAEHKEDKLTFEYLISLKFNGLSWLLYKRFSQFTKLSNDLENGGYIGLPSLPPKTLIGRPVSDDDIKSRRIGLQLFIWALLTRPDTRTSNALLEFIEFHKRTNVDVDPLGLLVLPHNELSGDCSLAVSALCLNVSDPTAHVLVCLYEDKTYLSRLGKMWTLIEPEELSAITVWVKLICTNISDGTKCNDDVCANDVNTWQRIYTSSFTVKARGLTYSTGGVICVGTDDGSIFIFKAIRPTIDSNSWVVHFIKKVHQVHTTGVLHMHTGERGTHLLSIGLDDCVRLSSLPECTIETGGKLTKRLQGMKLTCCYFEDIYHRVLLGTDKGNIIIYDTSCSPPVWLHTLFLNSTTDNTQISTSISTSVASIEVSRNIMGGVIIVGHSTCITVFGYKTKGKERRICKYITLRLPHICENIHPGMITCMSVDEITSLIITGHENGVIVWNLTCEAAVIGYKCGHDGLVSGVQLLRHVICPCKNKNGNSDLLGVTGGRDGVVRLWGVPNMNKLVLWNNNIDANNYIQDKDLSIDPKEVNYDSNNASLSRLQYTKAAADKVKHTHTYTSSGIHTHTHTHSEAHPNEDTLEHTETHTDTHTHTHTMIQKGKIRGLRKFSQVCVSIKIPSKYIKNW
eukprot:GHVR01044074.1.p1 GENE.GHVR01044074.1~~GHVR01044074.1.p1  ORF type:complete len:638 (+),score=166.89 GHVR01044074.1:173-2086(+)